MVNETTDCRIIEFTGRYTPPDTRVAGLTAEDIERFEASACRDRSLLALLKEVSRIGHLIVDAQPELSEECCAGIVEEFNALCALIAMHRPRNTAELDAKDAVLSTVMPGFEVNGNLMEMAHAAMRADIARLYPSKVPPKLRKWTRK